MKSWQCVIVSVDLQVPLSGWSGVVMQAHYALRGKNTIIMAFWEKKTPQAGKYIRKSCRLLKWSMGIFDLAAGKQIKILSKELIIFFECMYLFRAQKSTLKCSYFAELIFTFA